MVSTLQSFQIFHEVPKEQLEWFLQNCHNNFLKEGDFLFKPGDEVNNTLVVLEGEISVIIDIHGEKIEMPSLVAGSVTGYLPYSRIKTSMASGIATKETSLLSFPKEKTKELIQTHFELTQALVSAMTTRARETIERQKQDEKMIALGKLSAGLAHELNNPIAAIASCAESLQKQIEKSPLAIKNVIDLRISGEELEKLFQFFKKRRKVNNPLTLMERSTLEEDFQDLLYGHNIENTCDIAETLVDNGIPIKDLEELLVGIPAIQYSSVLNYVNENLKTERIINDIKEASTRISDLVKSIKVYTHMDQSKVKQQVDLHEGLMNTLKMLEHKIKQEKIKVDLDLDSAIVKIMAFPGDLNQMWTNLIDNAIDAMEGTEEKMLFIKTSKEKHLVKINIQDSGKGIPEDIKNKIFDPFFTTKEVGKGTGLGLDTVNSIIKMHKGTIKVQSEPGTTVFEVCLPFED